jgi:uncharacterized protein (DUF983 family)
VIGEAGEAPQVVLGDCPRCGRPLVFASFPYGEPTCWDDACGWSASDGGWGEK